MRRDVSRLIERGQDEGEFVAGVPPLPLAYAVQSSMLGLLAAVTDGVLDAEEAPRTAATVALQLVGVPQARRERAVDAALYVREHHG